MNVLSVAYFSGNEEIKTTVLNSDQIRTKVLKLCLKTPGYNDIQLEEKNKLYDSIKNKLTK